jgi:hypothetical protein
MKQHVPFPKVLYHEKEAPRTVQSEGEQAALGADWHETPHEKPTAASEADDKLAAYAAAEQQKNAEHAAEQHAKHEHEKKAK